MKSSKIGSIIQIQMIKVIAKSFKNRCSVQFKSGWFWRCFYVVQKWICFYNAFVEWLCVYENWMILNLLRRVNILYNKNLNDCQCVMFLKMLESHPYCFEYNIAQSILPRAGKKKVMWRKMKKPGVLYLWIFGWLVTILPSSFLLYIAP